MKQPATGLAFPGDIHIDQSKIGIPTASLLAALLGGLILWKIHEARKQTAPAETLGKKIREEDGIARRLP